MKIVVFGASGRTGVPLVEQALASGHTVTAFVRDPSKLPVKHPQLRIVQGDVHDASKVDEAIQGQDAVISVLGPVKNAPKTVMRTAAQNIIAAMKKHAVRRIITLTGAGVPDPADKPRLFNKIISGLLKLTAPDVLEDSLQHVQTIRTSDLDWTVVRVPVLMDGAKAGKLRVGYVGTGPGARIVRSDVADFMLKQLSDTTYMQKAPMISN